MVRHFLLLTLLLLAMGVFGGCATGSDAPRLFTGMSRDRLRARFGEPLRVEPGPGGGEDWYYTFSGSPDVQATRYHDVQSGSDSVSVTISDTTSAQASPIHLSADGYVIEPLPQGRIVR